MITKYEVDRILREHAVANDDYFLSIGADKFDLIAEKIEKEAKYKENRQRVNSRRSQEEKMNHYKPEGVSRLSNTKGDDVGMDDYLDKYEDLRVAIRYKLEIETNLRDNLCKSLADEIIELVIVEEENRR